jgi:hypothetical protein
MQAQKDPVLAETGTLIRVTGAEIENITERLADRVALVDETCAAMIRNLGAELASEIRQTAFDLSQKPLN